MKILQVNNFHYPRGGSDRYFLEITRLLQEAGHDVRTFSTSRDNNIEKDWLVTSPSQGVDTENVRGVGNVLRFLYSDDARRRMQDALVNFKPDIAHLHIYYGQLTASILAPLRDAGIPVVQTLHEYKLVCATHGLYSNGHFCDACQGKHHWRAVMNRCNRGSYVRSLLSMTEAYLSDAMGAKRTVDRFIAVSEFQKTHLVRLGITEKKIVVLHHFTDTVIEPPNHIGTYFLFVGRIIEGKGLDVLLDAYARLGGGSPPLKVVGTGIGIERWHERAVELGLRNRVEWLGFKTGDELEQLYRECIAVINPSLLNETFGLTCLEALARGRPVIASRVGAFPEVVSEGEDGFLVEPGVSDALAEAMDRLASHPKEAKSMGSHGWEKVNRKFSRQQHYTGLQAIYDELLGE